MSKNRSYVWSLIQLLLSLALIWTAVIGLALAATTGINFLWFAILLTAVASAFIISLWLPRILEERKQSIQRSGS